MVYIPNAYSQLDQWNSVMFLYESALKAINTKIEILNEEFIHMYGHTPIEHIKSRVKTPDSIVKKMKRNGYEVTIENMVEKLSDIAGIRIICSFNQDIYQIADMIARQKDVTVLYVKDYIRKPKPNGYKSYHMVVTIPLSDGGSGRNQGGDPDPNYCAGFMATWSIRSITSLKEAVRTLCRLN